MEAGLDVVAVDAAGGGAHQPEVAAGADGDRRNGRRLLALCWWRLQHVVTCHQSLGRVRTFVWLLHGQNMTLAGTQNTS